MNASRRLTRKPQDAGRTGSIWRRLRKKRQIIFPDELAVAPGVEKVFAFSPKHFSVLLGPRRGCREFRLDGKRQPTRLC